MSGPAQSDGAPVARVAELVESLAAGCKPASRWRIGTEHEKFVFHHGNHRPAAYEGADGIGALLAGLQHFGWQPGYEDGKLIDLRGPGGAAITLEPGGQLELSGAPLATVHDTYAELVEHLRQVAVVGEALGLGVMGMGFQPRWPRAAIPWMPKARYRLMAQHMPAHGALGLDMMLRSCAVQVNLDFASESDMVRKMRVSQALQPVATALLADSPFVDGAASGYLSYRSYCWTQADPQRCGILPFVFAPGFGFERYVDWALDVPMYFVYRHGRYVDARGQSFRDFLAGRLPALPGERPTRSDWTNHLTELFPEVRLKQVLEMRGADAGSLEHMVALVALWVGLLYDAAALGRAEALCADWSADEVIALRDAVPATGLETPFRGAPLLEVARRVVDIAREGLVARQRLDGRGRNEAIYLTPLEAIAQSGVCPAAAKLAALAGPWGGRIDAVFEAAKLEPPPQQ